MPVIRRNPDCRRPESVHYGPASQPPPAAHARDRRRPGKRHSPRAHRGRSDRREVRSRAHRRLRPGKGRRGLVLAGPSRAHHGSPGAEDCAGGATLLQRTLGNDPHRERRGAAGAGRRQHAVLRQLSSSGWLSASLARHSSSPSTTHLSCSRPTWSGRPTQQRRGGAT